MGKIIKQLPPNDDTYYIEHNRTTDSFRVRKDNKIKINGDSDNDIVFKKKNQSHPRDRLARKVRRSKRLANKKVRESETGPMIMPMGALLAAGKIKRKYAKNRKKDKTKKAAKKNKELSEIARKIRDPEKKKVLEMWMRDNIKKELVKLNG